MNESKKIEWVKLFIDLIGKLSYPIVILILVFHIIGNSQFHALLNKLTGAKLGNTEFTFQVVEDKAANEAKLNSHIQELKRKTEQLEEDLKILLKQQNVKHSQLNTAERNKRIKSQELLAKNSNYSILVFNKPSQTTGANQILELLLKSGYSASRTTTDLSELNPLPAGTIFITRNNKGDKIINNIIKDLKTLSPNFIIHKQKRIQPLRRGDIQISFF